MEFTMSNPGGKRTQVNPVALLYGNPPRRLRLKRKASTHTKGNTVAKKRRSAAQKAATKKLLSFNRAKRSGKRKARKVSKATRKSSAPKKRRGARRARRARRSAVAAPIVKRVYITKRRKGSKRRKTRIEIRRVKRSHRRSGPRGSLLRTLSVNPANMLRGYMGAITGVLANLKASVNSTSGILGLAGGAVGAVAGGTLLARLTMPLALRFAPGIAGSPMGARALSFVNYSLAGYLLAKFLPVNEKIKRGILAGTITAAIIEIVRPGTVQAAIAQVPVIGPMIAGNLGGIEPELGQYIEEAMNGLAGNNSSFGGAAQQMLGQYELGAYEMGGIDGLGCASPAAQELVSYDD